MKLDKIFQLIDLYEEAVGFDVKIKTAHDFIGYFMKQLKTVVGGGKYFEVKFVEGKHNNGIVLIKFANVEPHATHSEAEKSNHMMVAIEGFDNKGNIESHDGKVVIDVFKYNSIDNLPKPKKVNGGLKKVADYLIRWFKSNIVSITKLHEDVGGMASAAPVMSANPGTASNPDISVYKTLLKKKKKHHKE